MIPFVEVTKPTTITLLCDKKTNNFTVPKEIVIKSLKGDQTLVNVAEVQIKETFLLTLTFHAPLSQAFLFPRISPTNALDTNAPT